MSCSGKYFINIWHVLTKFVFFNQSKPDDAYMRQLWKRIGVMLCKNRHKLILPEDLQLLQKTYKSSGWLITAPEDQLTTLKHLLTAPEHFRNCSKKLS